MSIQTPERFKVVEMRSLSAPHLPTDRPPTKREAWEHYSHIYGDVKTQRELVAFVREAWAWHYITWWRERDWRKQPDWTPGQPVFANCVPHAITVENWQRVVHDSFAKAQERKAA